MTKTVIAVDFDGTLCKAKYPDIGAANSIVIYALNRLQKERNCTLILWTCRVGEKLQEAVDWCKDNDLIFDYINENVPERIAQYGSDCRKISADYYIDDKALLGSEVEKISYFDDMLYKIYTKLDEVHGSSDYNQDPPRFTLNDEGENMWDEIENDKRTSYKCLGNYPGEHGCDLELDSYYNQGECENCSRFGCVNNLDCENCSEKDCQYYGGE